MRPLRVLTAIPLVAGLLFAGAATASAQSAPVIPSVPGLGNLPYVNAGFPCWFPQTEERPTTNTQIGPGATDESFVFLMPSTQTTVPSQPGMGQLPDLSFMKCFFHYPDGTVYNAPYMDHGFPCSYSNEPDAPVSSSQGPVYHQFAHSTLIVRDMFAILLCWGTEAAG